jgi:D-alanyl-D-alanine dipeptidase
MKRRGFTNYYRKWWHYEHRHRTEPSLDIPTDC